FRAQLRRGVPPRDPADLDRGAAGRLRLRRSLVPGERTGGEREMTTSTVSRRALLRHAGVAGVSLLVAGTGALSYRVYDQAILDPDGGPAFDPWRVWRHDPGPLGAVAAAILAANPHNSQPWLFRVSTD